MTPYRDRLFIAAPAGNRYDSVMRLAPAKIPQIAADMVNALTAAGDIETDDQKEVVADVKAVLEQYVRDEQTITDRARDLISTRSLPGSELARMKKLVADEMNVKIDDEAVDYLLDQLVEMLMHSHNVEEVYAEDVDLRRKMRGPLRKQAAEEEKIEQEIRQKLKHVEEGGHLWEVEYQRMRDDLRRRRGL